MQRKRPFHLGRIVWRVSTRVFPLVGGVIGLGWSLYIGSNFVTVSLKGVALGIIAGWLFMGAVLLWEMFHKSGRD